MSLGKSSAGVWPLVAVSILAMTPARAELRLELDPAATRIPVGQKDHRVVVWLHNSGLEAIPVLGGTLQVQIGTGSGESGAPRIVGLHLPDQTGSLFRADNAALTTVERSPWRWTGLILTVPESLPTEVWVPPLQRLPIATVILDASALSGTVSSWRMFLRDTAEGDSVFDQIDPADRGVVVPIAPEAAEQVLALDTTPQAPSLTVQTSEDGTMSLGCPIAATGSVHLERRVSLESGVWQRLDQAPRVEGPRWRWDLAPEGGSSQMFYRIVTSAP